MPSYNYLEFLSKVEENELQQKETDAEGTEEEIECELHETATVPRRRGIRKMVRAGERGKSTNPLNPQNLQNNEISRCIRMIGNHGTKYKVHHSK